MPTKTNVKVIGLEKLQRKLDVRLTEGAVRELMQTGARMAEEEAEKRVPRRTGALVRSLSASSNDMSARVSTSLRYARFVEHGARGSRPRRFMANAKAKVQRELKKLIQVAADRIEREWAA